MPLYNPRANPRSGMPLFLVSDLQRTLPPAYVTFGRELHTPDDVHRDLRAIVDAQTFVPKITLYLRLIVRTLQKSI